jgi:hypothetical protein
MGFSNKNAAPPRPVPALNTRNTTISGPDRRLW